MSDPEFELTDELASLFEALHDSEINGEIGWFFDRVWRAKLGDPWNGYVAEQDGLLSLAEGCEWLREAIEHYPTAPSRRITAALNASTGRSGGIYPARPPR